MTMQIAVRASDGFVLASDLSTRTSDAYGSPVMVASYAAYESKTRINEKHQIGFALAGATPTGADAPKDLDDALTAVAQLPKDFAAWLEQWAEQYAKRYPTIKCSFLVVNPTADANRIVTLPVEAENCRAAPDLRCRLHPDPTNPANFWPQYFKCQEKPTVDAATKIAAITIFMGGKLSPLGISGLEVLQYRKEWRRLTERDIETLEGQCEDVKRAIDKMLGA